jgi:hypothetical protein
VRGIAALRAVRHRRSVSLTTVGKIDGRTR